MNGAVRKVVEGFRSAAKQIPYARSIVRWMRGARPQILPGMTSYNEQLYLRRYAADMYSGAGEIVDLGCWLGSTTIPLAQGLKKNLTRRQLTKRIHAYDRFIWEPWMDPFSNLAARQYLSGESFLAEFEERTEPYKRWIQIYAGDLTQIGWTDGSIELLIVDAMKSPDMAKFIVREFYGKILPVKGLVFHQDFKHFWTSWIHLIQYRLRNYFALETSLKDSAAVVFRLNKPLDCNLNWLDQLDSISDDEVESAFEYSMSLVGNEVANVAAAKVMHFIHAGRRDRAKKELERFLQIGFPKDSELSHCATRLGAMS
jgi:hypothetical protein